MRLLFICSYICLVYQLHAQDIEVKKFELMEKDQTATLSPRKDINGNACGLLKVSFEKDGMQFDGNIIGDVLHQSSEYWVYLSRGTKRINIKHPESLPKTIVFADYGISRIEENKTYHLVLKDQHSKNKSNSGKKKAVIFNIKPVEAKLCIDDEDISKDDEGIYVVPLTYGQHYYSVSAENFALNNQVVNVNSKTKTVDVNMVDYYSYLNLSCPTEGVDFYVNGILKGNNKWNGNIPPGNYIIEARKSGCAIQSKTMELRENDSINIIFQAMSAVTSKLTINFKPDGSEVILDAKSIGTTPLQVEIPIGDHRISIKKEYYQTEFNFFDIEEGQDMLMEGTLKYKDEFSEIYVKANEGDANYQLKLAHCYYGWTSRVNALGKVKGWDNSRVDKSKAFYWYEKAAKSGNKEAQGRLSWFYGNGKVVKQDPSQAFYWAEKSAEQNDDYGCYLLGWHYAYGVGVEKNIEKAVFWLKKSLVLSDGWESPKKILRELGY